MNSLKVKINGIFLSQNGTDFSVPCKLELPEYEQLQKTWTGNVSFAASGKAATTLAPAGDVPFQIRLYKLHFAVYSQIINLAKSNIAAQAAVLNLSSVVFPVTVEGYSSGENLSFNAVFDPEKPYKRESFRNDGSFDIVLNLIKIS